MLKRYRESLAYPQLAAKFACLTKDPEYAAARFRALEDEWVPGICGHARKFLQHRAWALGQVARSCGLPPAREAGNLPLVRFPQLLLALVAILLAAAGCSHHPDTRIRANYYQVTVTTPTGALIANWIARGYPWGNEVGGFRFRAIERTTGGRFPQTRRYPYGKRVEASGPNIIIKRVPQPLWHAELGLR